MKRRGKCIDCACCDVENLKCYPNDRDCMPEYDLNEEDLTSVARCDFFKPKEKANETLDR